MVDFGFGDFDLGWGFVCFLVGCIVLGFCCGFELGVLIWILLWCILGFVWVDGVGII